MKVLVCGGRDFEDYEFLKETLNAVGNISTIIHGGARGADTLAQRYAEENNIPIVEYTAFWFRLGKRAGVERNERMLRHSHPDLVIAFKGGKGTQDMIDRTIAAGIPLKRPEKAAGEFK